jgi:hypothetical protein
VNKIEQAKQIIECGGICQDYYGKNEETTYRIDCYECICNHICYDCHEEHNATSYEVKSDIDSKETRIIRMKFCQKILRKDKLNRILR